MRDSTNLGAYHTGLFTPDYARFPQPPYHGCRWRVELTMPVAEFQVGSMEINDKVYPAMEVIVWSGTEETAQRAADLIHAARLLLEGSNVLSHLYPCEHAQIYPVRPNETVESLQDENDLMLPKQVMTMNIPLACLVAARASWRLQYVYALSKLRLSFETFSTAFVDLDPSLSPNVPRSPLPEDHVRFAFAIVAAYSCIEELGLEIRASQNKPSKLPNGTWNPVVRTELEKRLRKSHINIKERCLWNIRGPRTRIERSRPPNLVVKAPWAKYHVRDGEMEVIDAIHYLSFLRSWVAAHRTDKRMLRVLSVYDVANAQFLARRLLLQKMGYWRYWGERQTTVSEELTGESEKGPSS